MKGYQRRYILWVFDWKINPVYWVGTKDPRKQRGTRPRWKDRPAGQAHRKLAHAYYVRWLRGELQWDK